MGRIAALSEIGSKHEVFRADGADGFGAFLNPHLAPGPHPLQMRLRSHQRAGGAQFQFRSRHRGLLHLVERHVDHFKLRMGDDDALDTVVARRGDHGQRLNRREVAGVDDQILLRANLQNLTHRRQHLSIRAQDLDSLGGILEMFDVMVSVDGREPHATPVAALHSPHPLHRVRIDSADRGIQDDSAEHLDACQVLAHEPGAIRRGNNVILEDHRLHALVTVKLRTLLVVERPPKNVGAAVEMGVDQSFDGADRRRWRREVANLSRGRSSSVRTAAARGTVFRRGGGGQTSRNRVAAIGDLPAG